MPQRKVIFAPGEIYHLCNRSVDKKPIFIEKRDWVRFLFLIIVSQSSKSLSNVSWFISNYMKMGHFNFSDKFSKEIIDERIVRLISFCIMPNHFHIIMEELKDNGISKSMQKIQDAYAKYFNVKYKKSGHVFQGPFRATHISNNDQLIYTNAYVHRNPIELPAWKKKEDKFPWSSYTDFIYQNRWGKLLSPEIILDQFENKNSYDLMVKSSGAKNVNYEPEKHLEI